MARILIADDDVEVQQAISRALQFEGHQVLRAVNGQIAIEVAKREKPDLVLMALMLPVINGRDAIRALREDPETRDLRIIAMSPGATLLRSARDLDADSVIGKPIDLAVLLADIEVHLQRTSKDQQ